MKGDVFPITQPLFVVPYLGIVLVIISQMAVERDLKKKSAMPEAQWWEQSSYKNVSLIIKMHRQLFPRSISLWLGLLGVIMFVCSPVLFLLAGI